MLVLNLICKRISREACSMSEFDATAESDRRMRLPKASAFLANELRAMILEQDLKVGDPLPSEAELIQTHHLARGTVREALRLLEVDGFIRMRRGPKGGPSVDVPSVDLVSRSLATLVTVAEAPLGHLFEIRKLIEPEAARVAACDATDEQRVNLLRICDPAVARRGTIDFHKVLGESTGNEFYRVFLASLNRVVEWESGLERLDVEHIEQAGEAHAKIAQAISDHDGELAATLMYNHIEAFEVLMNEQGRLNMPTLPRALWIRHLRQNVHGN
jgi:GntR family transcriptional repressor for pyruvate dehydrogenase complex